MNLKKLMLFSLLGLGAVAILESCQGSSASNLASASLTVTASGDGNETLSATTASVTTGGTASFTVTANSGYSVSNSVGGTCVSGSWSGSTYTTGLVTAACTVTFSAAVGTYSVTASGDGNETISPSSAQTVSPNGTQAYTVTATSGHVLSTSVGGTCPAGSWSGSTYTTGAVTSDCTVTFSVMNTRILYRTAAATHPNLTTIAAFDAYCMSDSNYPGTGTYKAVIVDGSTRVACTVANCGSGSSSTDWVLQANTVYTRADGTIIATTSSAPVFSFPLTHGIASSGSYPYTWTGLTGTWLTSTSLCVGWTSTSSGQSGSIAYDATATSSSSITGGARTCDDTGYLYCAEQ